MKKKAWLMLGVLFLSQYGLGLHLASERSELGMDSSREGLALDPIELVGTRLLSPFRAFMVSALWIKSQSPEIQDNVGQLPVIYDLITSIQPNLVEAAIFAAMNLGMDLSIRTDDPGEQWHWVREGFRILDKSIERNDRHPRRWRLEFQRAYLITQRCLPTSKYIRHGDHCAQMYERTFNANPREDAAASLRNIISEPKVPTGWLFMYPGIYESWALESEDPAEEAKHLEKAVVAWSEVLSARTDLRDDGTRELLVDKLALALARGAALGGGGPEREAWVQAGWAVMNHQWLDPQVAKHFRGERTVAGDNLYLALMERRALDFLDKGDHVALADLCSICREGLEDPLMAPPSLAQKIRFLKFESLSHDVLAGACEHMASTSDDKKTIAELSQIANTHRHQAIQAYERLLELIPGDEECTTKITLLRNAIK